MNKNKRIITIEFSTSPGDECGYYGVRIDGVVVCEEFHSSFDIQTTSCSYKPFYLTPENEITVSYGDVCVSTEFSDYMYFSIGYLPAKENYTYRYEGKNVNNYIKFDNEIWRIIGLEEGSAIGLEEGKYYPKIIRNTSLGKVEYLDGGEFIDGNWGNSLIRRLLNYNYFNRRKVESSLDGETIIADYTTNGMQEDMKKLIVSTAQTNAIDISYISTLQDTYRKESLKTVINRISLMNASDYGFAALQSVCSQIPLTSYSTCADNNWLYTGDSEWIISSVYGSDYMADVTAIGIDTSGNIEEFDAWESKQHRPVVYLDPMVRIDVGTGELGNEYEIDY